MPSPPIPLSHLTTAPEPARRYRLLELVRRRLRELRHSPRTGTTYVAWIRRYILFHDRRHPRDLGVGDVRAYLSHLARDRDVAASTQNQALAALTFQYDRVLLRPLERIEGVRPSRRSRHGRPFSRTLPCRPSRSPRPLVCVHFGRPKSNRDSVHANVQGAISRALTRGRATIRGRSHTYDNSIP